MGVGGHIVAFVMHLVPKIGPFKAMKLKLPDFQEQVLCLKSINSAEDKYKSYLAQIHAEPIPVPPPSQQDVDAAKKEAAAKVAKDATQVAKEADKAKDPHDKAKKEDAAVKVDETALRGAGGSGANRSQGRCRLRQSRCRERRSRPPRLRRRPRRTCRSWIWIRASRLERGSIRWPTRLMHTC